LFSNSKEVVLQLPGLEAGSVSVLSYERELIDTAEYFFDHWISSVTDRRLVEIEVVWEDEAPALDFDPDILNCEKQAATIVCSAEDVKKILQDHNVAYRDVVPQFIVSKKQTWQEVIDGFNSKVGHSVSGSRELAAVMARVNREPSPINAAVDLVSRRIRYVSFSEGAHSHLPHKLDDTLRNKYGDCKDKSALLYKMLLELGYEAYPVLVATNRRDPDRLRLPSIKYFNHMVVCVSLEDGEVCLDPTDTGSTAQATSDWIQGKVRLNVKPGGTPTKIPADEYLYQMEVENRLTFLRDGGQKELLSRTIHGQYGNWMRQRLNESEPVDQEEWMREKYHEVVSSDVEVKFNVFNLDLHDKPLEVESSALFSPFVDTNADLNYNDAAFWIKDVVLKQRIENKHYPVIFPGIQLSAKHYFDLNGIWKHEESGPSVNFETRFGSMKRTYIQDGDVILVSTSVDIPRQAVDVGEFKDFNRLIDLIAEETTLSLRGSILKR
jgi:hypothetical protein